ncbi:hypothetical protein RhiLY_05139 [Ceratobasidium sp. AG-Ba]|nr:hypothetical protein RhiLY_05139 [Ceratobasidium sp. AG-Ba]
MPPKLNLEKLLARIQKNPELLALLEANDDDNNVVMGEGSNSRTGPAAKDRRRRSPTLGRSSDPVCAQGDERRGRSTQQRSLALSRSDSGASQRSSRGYLESPARQLKVTTKPRRGQSSVPALPPSTPPAPPRSDDNYPRDLNSPAPRRRSPSPHHDRHSASRQHGLNSRNSSVAPRHPAPKSSISLRQSYHSPERDQSQPHRSRSLPPSPSPGPWSNSPAPRRDKLPDAGDLTPPNQPADSNKDPDHVRYDYDNLPTSYEVRAGERSGRIGVGKGKKKEIAYTQIVMAPGKNAGTPSRARVP